MSIAARGGTSSSSMPRPAFVAAGRVDDLAAGVALAAATIDDGTATALLVRLRAEKAAHDLVRAASSEVSP